MTAGETYDLVVIGSGAAGLAAAVTALEEDPSCRVAVVERSRRSERGGNSRWSSAFFRMNQDHTPAAGFESDFHEFTLGKADPTYVARLESSAQEAIDWASGHGVGFEMVPMFFLTASKPRLGVAGGGASIVEVLATKAESLGATLVYETTAETLLTVDGVVTGVRCSTGDETHELLAPAVILASGGFEGNPTMMLEHYGENAEYMKPVARGGSFNRGEGIAMALEVGAARTGEWSNFHGEPVDPRSNLPEAVVMTFPYGILVNAHGDRFVDEASSTVDEIYEDVCRAIFAQDGNLSYLIADSRLYDLPGFQRATLTDRPAYESDTIAGLAKVLDIEADALQATVDGYNAATRPDDVAFDESLADGLSATGIDPVKSNWARDITVGPFVAYPISTAICFTYGGIGVDEEAQVVRADGSPIEGLWAAGEMTGIYHGKYPGATSVLRSLVFGRIAARAAVSRRPAVSGRDA